MTLTSKHKQWMVLGILSFGLMLFLHHFYQGSPALNSTIIKYETTYE